MIPEPEIANDILAVDGRAPDGALDLAMTLFEAAQTARKAGWTVNMAVESGRKAEVLTFSASYPVGAAKVEAER